MNTLKNWLGPGRAWTLIGLLALTGGASLVLQLALPDESWSTSAQTGLVVLFLGAALVLISGVLPQNIRQRVYLTAIPALAALALAVILPGLLLLFLGLAVGWLIGAQFLLRENANDRDYKRAVKAMRKQDYDTAVDYMNALIQREPDAPNHVSFRAQLHRLRGDLRRAQSDYERVMKLMPESAVGPNGLAELHLQRGDLDEARRWAEDAYQKAPEDWIAVYNLGMIEERQGDDEAAIRHLNEALALKMDGGRHRVLAKLWLAKIHHRRGESDQSEALADDLRDEKRGLKEWETILESDEAASLRDTLGDDIRMAQAIAKGESLSDVFDAAR